MRKKGGTGRSLPFRATLWGWIALFFAAGLGAGAAEEIKAVPDQKQGVESTTRKNQREENLKAMEERARGARLRLEGEVKDREARLIAQPLFHYTDEPRRITDATLWGWASEVRLVAICKIEKYDIDDPAKKWLYCFGSLSAGLIEGEWEWGHAWSAKKPGIELARISPAPEPAEGKAARLRQMKEIAARFAATIIDTKVNTRQEMRLLPRPIHRYEKPTGELIDGAVFGLTSNGTNPDAVLVLELHDSPGGKSEWMFGVTGMTAGGLSIKFDDKEVWSKPYSGKAESFENWTWFWEKRN